MTKVRKHFNAAFKLKAVLEVLKGEKTANEIAGKLGVHPMQLSKWKQHFLSAGAEIFDKSSRVVKKKQQAKEEVDLYEQIGRLKMQVEWLKKKIAQWN